MGLSPVQGFDTLLDNSLFFYGLSRVVRMTVTRKTKLAFWIGRRDMETGGPTHGCNGGDSGLVGWRHPHRLAALFMCGDAAELRENAQWAGSGAEGRVALLRELQVRRLSGRTRKRKGSERSRVSDQL